jgi:transcriptional regulator with XRE-family HTH domain
MLTGMVTRIGTGKRQHLYIEEHMRAKGLSDQDVADRLETSRVTVYRWRKEQRKLTPEKIAALAEAIGIDPEQFWRLPGRPSVDAILRDAPIEIVAEIAAEAARKVVRGR